MTTTLQVELAIATPERQVLTNLRLAAGTSAREALLACDAARDMEGIDPASCALGVWGRIVDDDYRLCDGDRIEAYRPLQMDPREARRRLAEQGKSMGGASAARD